MIRWVFFALSFWLLFSCSSRPQEKEFLPRNEARPLKAKAALVSEKTALTQQHLDIRQRLKLVIPKVNFVNKRLSFIVEWLKEQSILLSADGGAVNINIPPNFEATEEGPEDEFDDLEGFADFEEEIDPCLINLNAENMSIADIIKYACQQLNLRGRIKGDALVLTDAAIFYELYTKFYPFNPELFRLLDKHADFKRALRTLGVTFPPGSKLKTPKKAMKFLMTNTAENHRCLDAFLEE